MRVYGTIYSTTIARIVQTFDNEEREMEKTDSHTDDGQEGNQGSDEVKSKIDIRKVIATALVALGFFWFNFSSVVAILTFLVQVFATFLLCFGGLWSARLIFKPRRIVTADQVANGMTLLQHMLEPEQQNVNPFIGKRMWKSPIKDFDAARSWDAQLEFIHESSASFLWMLSIIFFTLTAHDMSVFLYMVALLAVMGLLINWFVQFRFYFAWPVISQKPAMTERYGKWLFERIQCSLVVIYCVGFIAQRVV